jgi:hypothetical protein
LKFEPYIAQIPDDISASRFSVFTGGETKVSETKDDEEDEEEEEEVKETPGTKVDSVDTVLKVVRALYDYAPANETEIILKEGEMVKVYQMADEWW